jgi:hypothetical protein
VGRFGLRVLGGDVCASGYLDCGAAVDPFTVSVNIALPREQVFEYLADIANHAEFSDHYLVDWRLTRIESYGQGAGARFRMKAPLNRFAWADMTIAELQPPFKIVERGRGGKFNRIKMISTYEIVEAIPAFPASITPMRPTPRCSPMCSPRTSADASGPGARPTRR